MSVPIKRLQELARHLPVHERRTVERFMEFVIADSEDRPTIDEIAMIRLSQAEIDKDEVVTWEPGMFIKSKSPKAAANKSIEHRAKSSTPSKKSSKKSPSIPSPSME